MDAESLDDALDRRHALSAAVALVLEHGGGPDRLIAEANFVYAWLRRRDTLRPASITLIPGTPSQEGTPPMAATFSMGDNDQVTFTLDGKDAKGADVPSPADTWSWALSDPDSSGAALTPSGDTLSAVLAAGGPTANLVVSAAGQSTGLQGACAVTITAGPASSVDLVPGDPTPV